MRVEKKGAEANPRRPTLQLEAGSWKLETDLERNPEPQLRHALLGLARVAGERVRLHELRVWRVVGHRAGVDGANRRGADVEGRVDRVGQVEEVGNQLRIQAL